MFEQSQIHQPKAFSKQDSRVDASRTGNECKQPTERKASGLHLNPKAIQLQTYSNIANSGGASPIQRQAAQGGLPAQLRSGIESLSSIAMHDVRVHYNSSKPAQLQAHAYAQGTDIHVAPGQERHLSHEAWHVVQQKQGRVKPTLQLKGIAINDDSALEREADVMGARALGGGQAIVSILGLEPLCSNPSTSRLANVLQPMWIDPVITSENGGAETYVWHQQIGGLRWHLRKSKGVDSGESKTSEILDLLYYEVVGDLPSDDAYWRNEAGPLKAKTLDDWLKDSHWNGIVEEEESKAPTSKPVIPAKGKFDDKMKKTFAFVEPEERIQDVRAEAHNAAKERVNDAGLMNQQCWLFAKSFQDKVKDRQFVSVRFEFADPKDPSLTREISISDPAHAYHLTEVGSGYHYATFFRVENEWIVFDNHHLDGIEASKFLAGLKFDLIRYDVDEANKRKPTGHKIASSDSVAASYVRVFVIGANDSIDMIKTAGTLSFNAFVTFIKTYASK